MATSLAAKALQNQNQGLLRFSLNFLRSFSTATASPASASSSSSSSTTKKPQRKKKKNLFEVAQFLPNWGIGYHMAKTHWTNVSYEITKINLYKVLDITCLVSFDSVFQSCKIFRRILARKWRMSSLCVKIFNNFWIWDLGFKGWYYWLLIQDGRHGKAWGIAYKDGKFCLVLLIYFL